MTVDPSQIFFFIGASLVAAGGWFIKGWVRETNKKLASSVDIKTLEGYFERHDRRLEIDRQEMIESKREMWREIKGHNHSLDCTSSTGVCKVVTKGVISRGE